MYQFNTREKIEELREKYPAGTRVVLDQMDDPQSPPAGTSGTVRCVDDMGDIHVAWNTGSSLALVPGVDRFHTVNGGK